MSIEITYEEASHVGSRAGAVDVDGPDGVHVTLSPEAATKTAMALLEKAAEAIGKRSTNEDARKRDLTPPYPD